LVQIAFIRISSNPKIIADAVTPREALEVLKKIVSVPGHHFWPDTVAPTDAKAVTSAAFVGHRQVTDAYLLSLAQHHKGKLATFDNGIAELIQANKERHQHITVIEA
jgi:predicted nucleic acid-binding protein